MTPPSPSSSSSVNLTVAPRRAGHRGLTFGEARSALVCRVGRFVAIRDRRVDLATREKERERHTRESTSVVLSLFVSERTRRHQSGGRTHASIQNARVTAARKRSSRLLRCHRRRHRPCEFAAGSRPTSRDRTEFPEPKEGSFQGFRPSARFLFGIHIYTYIFLSSALRPYRFRI